MVYTLKVLFTLLLLGGVVGAQSCRVLDEAGAAASAHPGVWEITVGELVGVLSSLDLLGDDRPASFMLFEDEVFNPDARTAVTCFAPLLFAVKEQQTLITYDLAKGRKLSETDMPGLPVEVRPVTQDVYALTLQVPGVGTAGAVLDLAAGRVLLTGPFGRFSSSSVALVLSNRVLIETSGWGQGRTALSVQAYEVANGAARELSTCALDVQALPALASLDYALTERGLVVVASKGVRFAKPKLLPECQEVAATLHNRGGD